jgi:hypothetical protein
MQENQDPREPESVAQPVAPEPFYKRHGLAFAISTLVLGIIVLFGAVGVGAFTVAAFASRAVPAMSWLSPSDRGDRGGAPSRDGREPPQNPGSQRAVVRGTIDAVSGSTWTLAADNGRTLTVKLTASTRYGHPGAEGGSASDFAKGDEVIVVGTRSGDTVTATRVLSLADFPLRPPSTPGPPATPGSGNL